MEAVQTRAETEASRGAQILVIGRRSLIGDSGPVLRALGFGVAIGLVCILLSVLVR
jgi:hypothetical protein